MKFIHVTVLCFYFGALQTILSQQEIGDKCTTSAGNRGICTKQTECADLDNIYNNGAEFAETCKLNLDGTPIICCMSKNNSFIKDTGASKVADENDDFGNEPQNKTETRIFIGLRKKQYSTKLPPKPVVYNYEAPTNDIYQDNYQYQKPYQSETVNNGFSNTRPQPSGFLSTLDNFGNFHVISPNAEPQNSYDTTGLSSSNAVSGPNYNNRNINAVNYNSPSTNYYSNKNNPRVSAPDQFQKNSGVTFQTGNGNSGSRSTRLNNDNVNYPVNNLGETDVVHYPNENKIPSAGNLLPNQNEPGNQGTGWYNYQNDQSRPNNGNFVNTGSQNGNRPVSPSYGNTDRLTTTKRSVSNNDEPIWGTTTKRSVSNNGESMRGTTTKRSVSNNDEPIWGTTERTMRRTTSAQKFQQQRISEQKCSEYSRNVTSTISAIPLTLDSQATSHQVIDCPFQATSLIVGGTKAILGQYPHMAALGFRSGSVITYNCGGTLISEDYVMTAAHCTHSSLGNPVTVRLGDLNLVRDDDGAQPQNFNVAQITVHPNYKPPLLYNDIALIRLNRKAPFSKNLRPACLGVKREINAEKLIATGWGSINYGEIESDDLLQVSLDLINNNQCNSLYGPDSKFPNGITNSILCAGQLSGKKDTCQGDSGGPLQIHDPVNKCIYYVVGITSTGKLCGAANNPGIYTRVSEYISWIESVVWKN